MKILILAAGQSNHTLKWVNSLVQRGHEVMLVTRGDQIDLIVEVSKNVKVEYLKFGGGVGYYLNAPRLRRIIKEFQPDVVDGHYATGYGTLARMANARPFIISCYGSDIYDFPHHSRLNMLLLRKNLLWADAIASTSEAMANEVKKILSDKNIEVTVTPFGVDTEKFKKYKNVERKRPIIGIVKYLEPIYDVELLIRAYAIVCRKTDYEPELFIYGGGYLEGELKNLSIELGVSGSVFFKGTVENDFIPDALNEMDVFVNCSVMESFGVTVVEAMACECPVVVTQTEGYKEIVDDGETGIVLSDRKPETMAEALMYLLDNPDVCKQMGKKGRQKVMDKYDWQSNVAQLERLFKNVYENYSKDR